MSDTKWGFEKEYGHRQLPFKWHNSSGFSVYDPSPLSKKSFRHRDLPTYREELRPNCTSYTERKQDKSFSSSAYGCHKEMPWTDSLRSRRNPFPGMSNRETRYTGQPGHEPHYLRPSGKQLAHSVPPLGHQSPTFKAAAQNITTPRDAREATGRGFPRSWAPSAMRTNLAPEPDDDLHGPLTHMDLPNKGGSH